MDRYGTIGEAVSGRAQMTDRRSLATSAEAVVRGALFLVVCAFFWITITPYVDLSGPADLEKSYVSNTLNQLCAAVLATLCLGYALTAGAQQLRLLASPVQLALLGMIAVSAIASRNADIASRRLVLELMAEVMAAAVLILPMSARHFVVLLSALAMTVLGLCFGGVILLPERSIHLVTDTSEPNLAGNWRGVFVHKNAAGSAMVMLIFVGLLVARLQSRAVGLLICGLAGVFLLFTQSKTSIALLPVTLLLTWYLLRLRSTAPRLTIMLGIIAVMNLFTVGTVLIPFAHDLVAAFGADPTFTNRDEIWRFAISAIAERPLLGQGFRAFWQTASTVYGTSSTETWAATIATGHNGYLDLALSSGLPALALALVWLLVLPLKHLRAAGEGSGAHRGLNEFYVRLWTFGLLSSCTESVLFGWGGPTWFMLLIAVFGLRLQAKANLVGE